VARASDGEAAIAVAQRATAAAELRLASERGRWASERAVLEGELQRLTAERDGLARHGAALEAERKRLAQELDAWRQRVQHMEGTSAWRLRRAILRLRGRDLQAAVARSTGPAAGGAPGGAPPSPSPGESSPARPPLTRAEIAALKARVEAAHGPWTAHNVQLAEGLSTLREGSVNFDEKARRCLHIVQGFLGADLGGLRVLDLGAGEGGLSLELAARGARVVAVEGRRANLAKLELAAQVRGLDVEQRCQDVRQLQAGERYDVVLCFGLLYHLDAASAVRLLQTIGAVAERLFVLDTHFSLPASEVVDVGGVSLRGHRVREHAEDADAATREAQLWASLGNDVSFWLSKPSLLNLLGSAGFDPVFETVWPLVYDHWDRQDGTRRKYRDRTTLVGVKGLPVPMVTTPAVNSLGPRDIPEDLEELLVEWTAPS
jgi:SAM-dependent methyltransferase